MLQKISIEGCCFFLSMGFVAKKRKCVVENHFRAQSPFGDKNTLEMVDAEYKVEI